MLSGGESNWADNGSSAKTAVYFLPGMLLSRRLKTAMCGLKNGYWNAKLTKLYAVKAVFQKTLFNDSFTPTWIKPLQ
jgi:hypothetical protein